MKNKPKIFIFAVFMLIYLTGLAVSGLSAYLMGLGLKASVFIGVGSGAFLQITTYLVIEWLEPTPKKKLQ
ncbi:hypothetical protein [Vibrio owensii]|uniref:hypothetical protein n=1 Tax=Vibrio owensii TaxID=696485 RepID=UPI003CC6355F